MKLRIVLVITLIGGLLSCKKEEKNPVVTRISFVSPPSKTIYTVGSTLDLSGLSVNITYDNDYIETVELEKFVDKGLTCTPENGTIISMSTKLITVKHTKTNLITTQSLFVYEPTVTDYDGNEYGVTKIGNQLWMTEDLKVTHYPNGSLIPYISDINSSGSANDEWASLGDDDDAICYVDDNSSSQYGVLYTWSAAIGGGKTGSDSRPSNLQGSCPDGWHLPSEAELMDLRDYLLNHSEDINNYSFSKLLGGYRNGYNGSFEDQGNRGQWWDSSEGRYDPYSGKIGAYSYYLTRNLYSPGLGGGLYGNDKSYGFSVRCVKD